jgi:cell division protein FtsL
MIIKFINAILILAVLVSASALYSLEQNKRAASREIARTETAIADEKENMKLLTAEWSSLTRPERLRKLATLHTPLRPIKAEQFVTIGELSTVLPAHPFAKLESQGEDSIGTILQGMDQ